MSATTTTTAKDAQGRRREKKKTRKISKDNNDGSSSSGSSSSSSSGSSSSSSNSSSSSGSDSDSDANVTTKRRKAARRNTNNNLESAVSVAALKKSKKKKKKKKKKRKKEKKASKSQIAANTAQINPAAAAASFLGGGHGGGVVAAAGVFGGRIVPPAAATGVSGPIGTAWGSKLAAATAVTAPPVVSAQIPHHHVLGAGLVMTPQMQQLQKMQTRGFLLIQQFLDRGIAVAQCTHLETEDLKMIKHLFVTVGHHPLLQLCMLVDVPHSVSRGVPKRYDPYLVRHDAAPKLTKQLRVLLKKKGPVMSFADVEAAFNSTEHALLRVAMFLEYIGMESQFDSLKDYCYHYAKDLAANGILLDHCAQYFYVTNKKSTQDPLDRIFSLVRAEENISNSISGLRDLQLAVDVACKECDDARAGSTDGLQLPWSTQDPHNNGEAESVYPADQQEFLLRERDVSSVFQVSFHDFFEKINLI